MTEWTGMTPGLVPDAGYVDGVAQTERITEYSEDQKSAMDFVRGFLAGGRRHAVIGGCAGTGKSSIIPQIVAELAAAGKYASVCAYTGKAVMVLKRKGLPNACTLHSFLYHCKLSRLPDGEVVTEFIPRPRHDYLGIELLVVDEASMLSREMFDRISRLPFKTLYIGDHFQLPPVGDDFNIMESPDIRMERVLRQREGDPIVMLATLARNGQPIPLGRWGSSMHTRSLDVRALSSYDEILTWTNESRNVINGAVRRELGYPQDVPVIGDKMLVRANNKAKNVFNGQLVYLMADPKLRRNGAWSVEFVDEIAHDDPFVMAQTDSYTTADASLCLTPEEMQKYRAETFAETRGRDWRKKAKYQIHLDWGYCLTVHASQGSSWEDVAVIAENRFRHFSSYSRWLYTAITRAEKSVTLISGDFNWKSMARKNQDLPATLF